MASYRAILFDLFETVVLFDSSRLPQLAIGGKARPSTTPLLMPLLANHLPGASIEAVHAALLGSWSRARLVGDHTEVHSVDRFAQVLAELALDPCLCPELALTLADTHAGAVCGSALLPDAHRSALAQLRQSHRLALVSNFDHGPACRRMLSALGLDDLFEAVVISAELGLRKPHPRPFEAALAGLGVSPEDALFVGDSLSDDVAGAMACGLDVCWINPRGKAIPEGPFAPRWAISSMAELPSLLDGASTTHRAGG